MNGFNAPCAVLNAPFWKSRALLKLAFCELSAFCCACACACDALDAALDPITADPIEAAPAIAAPIGISASYLNFNTLKSRPNTCNTASPMSITSGARAISEILPYPENPAQRL